jgi:hypothetical protein
LLQELTVTQAAGEPRRRWFADEYFDLVVWMADADGIAGFELCYDKPHAERAVTWSRDGAYGFFRVDTGADTPTRNLTPILVPDGSFPRDQIIARFTQRSGALDPVVRAFVLQRLRELPPS